MTSQRIKWAEYVDIERQAPNKGWVSVKIDLDVVLPSVRGGGGGGSGGNGGSEGRGGGGGNHVGASANASADASAGHTVRLSATLGTTVGALLDQVIKRLPRDQRVDDHVGEQVAERHVFKVAHQRPPPPPFTQLDLFKNCDRNSKPSILPGTQRILTSGHRLRGFPRPP